MSARFSIGIELSAFFMYPFISKDLIFFLSMIQLATILFEYHRVRFSHGHNKQLLVKKRQLWAG